jgi:regulatory protein
MTSFDKPSDDKDEPKLSDVEASALRILAGRPHAQGELERKLRKRDYPDELIAEVCRRMREFGYLDDEQFAEDQAAILKRKGWGPRQIGYKLGNTGLDDVVVDEAIANLGSARDWQEACRERVRSKYRCDPGELDFDGRKKAFRHLKYRGFRESTIRRVLFD